MVLDLTTDTTAWAVCESPSVFHNGVIGIFSHEEYRNAERIGDLELLCTFGDGINTLEFLNARFYEG